MPLSPHHIASQRRGGVVLVVVLALMTSLAFLGLFFYSLSDAELQVATAFAQSPDQFIDSDAVNDVALEQIIVSTPAQLAHSALHGGTFSGTPVSDKSLLAHVLGLISGEGIPADVRPRDGRGIGVYGMSTSADGLPAANISAEIGFDLNGDGVLEAVAAEEFRWNMSALANDEDPLLPFSRPFERSGTLYANTQPDVDYTYPDVNSPFLAYDSTVTRFGNSHRVQIPSYFRPQLFPDLRTDGFADLYTSPATLRQVLRPHSHSAYDVSEDRNHNGALDPGEDLDGDGAISRIRRYVTAAQGTPALSGDRNRVIGPFPFHVGINEDTNGDRVLNNGEDRDGDGVLDRPNDMGVFSGLRNSYQLDVDADGDGVLDSIWLDLDHPLIDLADGRQAVPIFYAKIIDADALLNVNFHGQLARPTVGHPFDYRTWYGLQDNWVHPSHLGLSVSEVNPLPALRADPLNAAYLDPADTATALLQLRGFYADASTFPPLDITNDGTDPDGFTRVQVANAEFARMLIGSPQYLDNLDYASAFSGNHNGGRYDDGNWWSGGTLTYHFYGHNRGLNDEQPGRTGDDDDRDKGVTASDENVASGVAHLVSFGGLLNPRLSIPPFVHPLDFSGFGNYPPLTDVYRSGTGVSYTVQGGGIGGVRDLSGLDGSQLNPSRWLYYGTQAATGPLPAAWTNPRGTNGPQSIDGIAPWPESLLHYDPDWDELGLVDENDELVADLNFPTSADSPFAPSEMPGLQLTDADWRLVGDESRLRKLAPFNFEKNRQAASIRQQFTTDSRDRLEHGHARALTPNRQFEFNDTSTHPLRPRFPPMFDGDGLAGGPFTSRHERSPAFPPGIDPQRDPFRPVTRRLLTIEENNPTNLGGFRDLPGQRLNINRLLINFDRNGNPLFRRLIPHPAFEAADVDTFRFLTDGVGGVRPMNHAPPVYTRPHYDEGDAADIYDPDIPPIDGYPPVPFRVISLDKFAQEAWARYDRQRLARDLYVLLYTVGGLDVDHDGDPFDPTTTRYSGADANSNGISDRVEAMAQFAVNCVDALDQDNVITRFEFDSDLSDGWTEPPSPRGVVLGVEAQQLVFSEALLIQQAPAASDSPATLHDEADGTDFEHRWLYLELRNASPFLVPLPTGSYRIARYLPSETGRSGAATSPIAATEFRTTSSGACKQVGPGENFLLGCHDGTVQNPSGPATSDFYAEIDDGTRGLEPIVPWSQASIEDPDEDPVEQTDAPHLDLDLVVPSSRIPEYGEFYRNAPPAPGGTALVEPLPLGDATLPLRFQLRLERRLNAHGFGFGETSDTWIEVDRIEVEGRAFAPDGDAPADIVDALVPVTSQERLQPLDETTVEYGGLSGGDIRRHSLISILPDKHTGNSAWARVNALNPAAGFTLWQPHFDRDFSSVYELLSIPVVGPDALIRSIHDGPRNRLSGWADSSQTPKLPFTAGGYFLHPDGQTDDATDPDDDNRWFRLFEFLEIPPRTHESIRPFQAVRRRTEGRIQLNTLRHESVLAGLIDDTIQLLDTAGEQPTIDQHDFARNWFEQFLDARDGVDPLTGLPLPGIPGAMPFRSMSFIDTQPNVAGLAPDPQLQNTILRMHHPYGASLVDPRLRDEPLFVARGTADIDEDRVDYHTRHRLLAKVANSTTIRSHVFVIWLGYELFEAHQPTADPDIVQIGARIEDLPGHREFIVVDMTRLEEAFLDDPADLDSLGNPVPGRFDFRKFIIHRKRIR